MKVVELSGGVGGARMARGLAALPEVDLTVVVNVGDDESMHGLHVSPDVDTVIYTIAGIEGPEGWGRDRDTFTTNTELARFGVDNRFRLGDLDLALNLYRSAQLAHGAPLSEVTSQIANAFGVGAGVVPATDDALQTQVRLTSGWTSFQDYFVIRQSRDEVLEIRFQGADQARPAPGVVKAIGEADIVVIGPSNPPLSIWPILSLEPIRQALSDHPRVIAVSPLFGGKALKGPADRVMASLGLPFGNLGVIAAYRGLVDALVIDVGDSADRDAIDDVDLVITDTRIGDVVSAQRLGLEIITR